MPIVAAAKLVDLSEKTIELQRRGRDGFSDCDGVRVEIDARLTVHVSRISDHIVAVVGRIGAAATFDAQAVRARFEPRLVEALAMMIVQMRCDEVQRHSEELTHRVLQLVGETSDGWTLVSLTVSRIEQAPIEAHDPNDIRDARGIRTITERTVVERQRAAELDREARVYEAKVRTDAEIAIAELIAVRDDALGRIATTRGRDIEVAQLEKELASRLEAFVAA